MVLTCASRLAPPLSCSKTSLRYQTTVRDNITRPSAGDEREGGLGRGGHPADEVSTLPGGLRCWGKSSTRGLSVGQGQADLARALRPADILILSALDAKSEAAVAMAAKRILISHRLGSFADLHPGATRLRRAPGSQGHHADLYRLGTGSWRLLQL